jgi:hypothetical protein
MVTARSIRPRARASLRALDDRWRDGHRNLSGLAPQHLYERDEKSVLHVVVARDGKGHLGVSRIEYVACDETLAVGEQLLRRNGQRLRTPSRQQAALSAHKKGIAKWADVALQSALQPEQWRNV